MAGLGSQLQVGSMSGSQVPQPRWTDSYLKHDLLKKDRGTLVDTKV